MSKKKVDALPLLEILPGETRADEAETENAKTKAEISKGLIKKYYSLKNILAKNARYNIIYGERSNGKTYAVLDYILQRTQFGERGAIIRRWEDDFKKKRGQQMFAGHVKNKLIEKYTAGEWSNVFYLSGAWYFCKYEGDTRITAPEPFCYAFSLNAVEHDKSTSYPDVTTVLFDEFLTRKTYLPDEFVLFMNALSTIVRDRDDVIIFMCGNTVNMYAPYYAEMGLKNIKQQEIGTIDLYEYGDSGLRVAVEYSDSPSKSGKKSDIYFAFDNPKLKMITKGAWEMEIYPHLPIKYTPSEIIFTYFIAYDGETMQCEIIAKPDGVFTYIHKKTTPLRRIDEDLIFSPEFNYLPNWRRKITKPGDEYAAAVWEFFRDEKVFYQDNPTGELVRNYVNWCKKEGG